jgi:hypothetical protein
MVVQVLKEGLREINVTAIVEPLVDDMRDSTIMGPFSPTSFERADLLVSTTRGTIILDIAIIQPDANYYLPRGNQAEFNPHKAMSEKEGEKKSKYNQHAHLSRFRFVPFVCSTYGALCQPALLFLKLMSENAEQPGLWLSNMLSRLSCVLQDSNRVICSVGVGQCVNVQYGERREIHRPTMSSHLPAYTTPESRSNPQ